MRDENARARFLQLQRLAKLEQDPDDPHKCIEADVEHLRLLEGVILSQWIHLWKGCMLPEARSQIEQIVDRHHGNGMWAKGLEFAIV